MVLLFKIKIFTGDTIMDERVEIALKGNEFKRMLENSFEHIKKDYDLKLVDIEVLSYLSKCMGENTPTDIYKRHRINKGHISQAIDTLLKKGYVEALPDMTDRRIVHYTVSDKANHLIHEIEVEKKRFENQILKGITEEEAVIFQKVTHKIIENISRMA